MWMNEDKPVGLQVIELCIESDSLNEWVLDGGGGGICDIIISYVSYSEHVFLYIILLNHFNVLAISLDV